MAEAPWFPFCSKRCRLVDLGRWLDSDYTIPGPPVELKPGHEANGTVEHDDEG